MDHCSSIYFYQMQCQNGMNWSEVIMVGNSSKVKNKLVRSKKEKVSFVTF